MDERKSIIRELTEKKKALTETRNHLLEDLGKILINRIGEDEITSESSGEGPAAVLAEYRKKNREIAESGEKIKSLEEDIKRLKELEEKITGLDAGFKHLEEELTHNYISIGREVLQEAPSNDFAIILKQQEGSLISKIDEHEKTLEELEGQKGGIFAWMGKNAKIAVEKAFLAKGRSDLQKLYRGAGEEYISACREDELDGLSQTTQDAFDQKKQLTSLTEELSLLKAERRKLGGLFGSESSPARRIHALEKNIADIQREIPSLYLAFASQAAADGGREAFSFCLKESDGSFLQKAEDLAAQIGEYELEIKKLKSAIEIDEEKAEIEKLEKAIIFQRQKITAAEEAIRDNEKQIAESQQHIEQLNTFIQGDHGS